MRINNLTRKTVLVAHSHVMHSILQKSIGLMFQSSVKEALIFPYEKEQRMSLHMLFVFTAIDVLFVDGTGKVVELKEDLKPFAFYNSRTKAVAFIELPEGTIRATKTRIGDRISY